MAVKRSPNVRPTPRSLRNRPYSPLCRCMLSHSRRLADSSRISPSGRQLDWTAAQDHFSRKGFLKRGTLFAVGNTHRDRIK